MSILGFVETTKPRIDNFIAQGITTLEIKSGYGLNFENEIKLLQVINFLDEIYPVNIIPTFLGAHTFPAEMNDKKSEYVEIIINKMLHQMKLISFLQKHLNRD